MKTNTGFPIARRRGNIPSKKFAFILGLCALSASFLVLIDEFTQGTQRRLNCSDSGRVLQQDPNEEGRNLSKISRMIDRVLDLVVDTPCTTTYPEDADQLADAGRIYTVQMEPSFDITSNDFFKDIDIADIDTAFVLSPQEDTGGMFGIASTTNLDNAERSLISSFTPEIYDPVSAEERKSIADKESVAYVIPLVSCPGGDYAPGVESTNEPEMTSDLYEASAVIKCAVCETTDAAATARRLGETRKLRELGDNLSAAEMNYTM